MGILQRAGNGGIGDFSVFKRTFQDVFHHAFLRLLFQRKFNQYFPGRVAERRHFDIRQVLFNSLDRQIADQLESCQRRAGFHLESVQKLSGVLNTVQTAKSSFLFFRRREEFQNDGSNNADGSFAAQE